MQDYPEVNDIAELLKLPRSSDLFPDRTSFFSRESNLTLNYSCFTIILMKTMSFTINHLGDGLILKRI